MELVEREEWSARKPKAHFTIMSQKPSGVKIHYTGGRILLAILEDHSICIKLVHQYQKLHMDTNKWLDLGYNFVVCPHRKVFEGRGVGHLPAANGAGLNSRHYAILALVGNTGFKDPFNPKTPNQIIEGIWDCIDYIRSNTKTGKEIKGHRDGYATDCPGDPLYKWIKSGAKDIRKDERR